MLLDPDHAGALGLRVFAVPDTETRFGAAQAGDEVDSLPPMASELDFSDFLADNAQSLYRTAYLLTSNSDSAAELVQDTMLHLYPKWASVRSARAPLAYVRRSLVNRFLSERRRATPVQVGIHLVAEQPGSGESVENQVANRDLVRRLLEGLPARQRAAIVLRYYDDLDDSSAADALGCPVATYRSLIRRGLARLESAASTIESGSA